MRIMLQRETFAFRISADESDPDYRRRLSPDSEVNPLDGDHSLDNTGLASDSHYEQMAQAEENRGGYKAPKQQVKPGVPSGYGGGGGGGTAGSATSSFDPKQWKSADDYAKSMSGKPYEYGGGHPGGPTDSVDCSGFMGNLYSIYTGKPTAFSTDSDFSKLGFEPGYAPGLFNIGTNGGSGENGHMAGTLPDGTHVESNGTNGVQYGGNAAGATDPQFNSVWHLPASATSAPSTPTIPSNSPGTTPMASPRTSRNMRRR